MLKFHEPINNFKPLAYPQGDVTQFWGENPQGYSYGGHNGWDIVRAYGTPILCCEAGKVVEVSNFVDKYNGKFVRVLGQSGEWVYLHLSEISVIQGQSLNRGDVLGKMGNTGFVVSDPTAGGYWKHNPYAGTHLHLTLYPGKIWSGEGTYNKSYPTGDRALLDSLHMLNGSYKFKVEDFALGVTSPSAIKASDSIAAFAAKKQAEGNTVQATQLYALASFLRSFGY